MLLLKKIYRMNHVFELHPRLSKTEVGELVEKFLIDSGFNITKIDFDRPWGGFFVLDEQQLKKFKHAFFEEVVFSEQQLEQKLSPKFLVVAPGARLSWQYHFRRAELWTLVAGEAALCRSMDDSQGPLVPMETGKIISLEKGERHRLIGTSTWGVVAEIWMHSDASFPSDEMDIVRLEDDYSRK